MFGKFFLYVLWIKIGLYIGRYIYKIVELSIIGFIFFCRLVWSYLEELWMK